MDIENLAKKAYEASFEIASLPTERKNKLILTIAALLEEHKAEIFSINEKDVANARSNGLSEAMVDRLKFNDARFQEMVDGVKKVADLPDPIGAKFDGKTVESSLAIIKKRVPLGVVGVIYESRPNVTIDIASLCLKSGNACILRGGSEAFNTNLCLVKLLNKALFINKINPDAVAFIESTDRNCILQMLKQDAYIDVIIPRGGEALHKMCVQNSSIPVIVGGFGISHIFVDSSADLEKAVKVIINSKVQKPSACNALDTLLVHEDVIEPLLKTLLPELLKFKVEVHAHGKAYALCKDYSYLHEGKAEDFDREWLALAMNIAVVHDVKDAVLHLRKHRASHSDAILTDSWGNAEVFCNGAGSACVYINAATRFTDGGQFGMGAEVAISTQKLHVRGPMGINDLTTYQYICNGDYLCRK